MSIKHAQADRTHGYKTWFMPGENPVKRGQFGEHILKLLLNGFTIINWWKNHGFPQKMSFSRKYISMDFLNLLLKITGEILIARGKNSDS